MTGIQLCHIPISQPNNWLKKFSTTLVLFATNSKIASFIEGVHYIRPFGGRKILFVWERIETEMLKFTGLSMDALQ